MKFCPKCGAVMIAKGRVLYCPRCGYQEEITGTLITLRKSVVFEKVVERRENIHLDVPMEAIFDTNITCPRCGKRGVYYWRRQRSSAESSDTVVKMYKCANCGYTWVEGE